MEKRIVNGYTQDVDGKWILTEEAKAAALAMYYTNRLAYDNTDRRHPIGRYSPTGEVIPFEPWPSKTITVNATS